jgi:predicted nucleic-acid-binding protein
MEKLAVKRAKSVSEIERRPIKGGRVRRAAKKRWGTHKQVIEDDYFRRLMNTTKFTAKQAVELVMRGRLAPDRAFIVGLKPFIERAMATYPGMTGKEMLDKVNQVYANTYRN